MAYASSPGIEFQEIDLTATAVATATSTGALAGVFPWGPVGTPVLVDDEDVLVENFGKPSTFNAETFFVGASFLAYSKSLQVTRAADDTTFNAVANTGAFTTSLSSVIRNFEEYDDVIQATANFANTVWVAKYPGEMGNSLQVSICDSAAAFTTDLFQEFANNGVIVANNALTVAFTSGSNVAVISTSSANQASRILSDTGITVGSILRVGNTAMGVVELRVAAALQTDTEVTLRLDGTFNLASNLAINSTSMGTGTTTLTRLWEHARLFDRAPGTSEAVRRVGGSGDELHVVVVDRLGKFSGIPGAILETWGAVSRATDAKLEDGTNNYYVHRINNGSKYLWWTNHRIAGYSNVATTMLPLTNTRSLTVNFTGGTNGPDESSVPVSALLKAYDTFESTEDIDVSLLMTGKARGEGQLSNYLVDNIGETRKDLVVFASPPKEAVVNNPGRERDSIVKWRDAGRYSSYVFYDSGYKQMYDKYNDIYRWVPLNGDMAGLAARTDDVRDPWLSFAGEQRGQLKNVVKLAYNPRKADRDVLYRNDVNSIVSTTTMGPHLLGDKTGIGRDSAFSRVNVRRLFIVLEKTIVRASRFALFEFNDDFTRAQFRNMVEPFLRDVQGRRGITKYYVQCDERNNTPQVIMSNQFVGSIFVVPNYSINNIKLNFVATRNGVEFETIIGSV